MYECDFLILSHYWISAVWNKKRLAGYICVLWWKKTQNPTWTWGLKAQVTLQGKPGSGDQELTSSVKPDTSQIQARYKPNASQIHQNCHNQVLTVYVCRRSRKPSYVWAWNMLIQKGHIQIGLARTIYIYGLHSVFWQRNHQTYGHIWGILYGSGQPYIQKLGSFS